MSRKRRKSEASEAKGKAPAIYVPRDTELKRLSSMGFEPHEERIYEHELQRDVAIGNAQMPLQPLSMWGIDVRGYLASIVDTILSTKTPIAIMRYSSYHQLLLSSYIFETSNGFILDDVAIKVLSYSDISKILDEVSSVFPDGMRAIIAIITDMDVISDQESAQPGAIATHKIVGSLARFYGYSILNNMVYRAVIATASPDRIASILGYVAPYVSMVDAPELGIEEPERDYRVQPLPQGLSKPSSFKRYNEIYLDKPVHDLVLNTVIRTLRNRPFFIKSILLFGLPGSGKTTLATSIGVELGLRVAKLNVESFVSKWYGETERRLANALDLFSSTGGGVLIMRNIENIFTQQENAVGREDSVMARAREILINRIRESADNILLVITSSEISKIPEYLVRDPLFGTLKIPVPPPTTQETIERILDHMLTTYGREAGVSIDANRLSRAFKIVSEAVKGYTVKEIEAIAKHAIISALNDNRALSEEDLYKALEIFRVDFAKRASDLDAMLRTAKMLGSPVAITDLIDTLRRDVSKKTMVRSPLSIRA